MKKLFLVLLSAATLVACNKDAIEALEMSVDQLEAQVTGLEQARDAAQTALAQANSAIQILQNSSVTHSDLDAAVASLQQAITDGDVGAIRDAQDALDLAVANLQSVIDSLTAISFEYNSSNGVLTITMADGTVYETDDLRGEDGAPGAAGIQGPVGPPGATGASGSNGSDGAGGLSAYQIWLNSGGEGTEDDFLASLEGDDGDAGAVGELNGWTPAFTDQVADFDQSNSAVIEIEGVEFAIGTVTRTITVSGIESGGDISAETNTVYLIDLTQAAFDLLGDEAKAELIAKGFTSLEVTQQSVENNESFSAGDSITIYAYSATVTTTTAQITTYTGTVSGTEDVVGTHDVETSPASTDSGDYTVVGDAVEYEKIGDPVDVAGEWAPAFVAQTESFTQSRTVEINGESDGLATERTITVTSATSVTTENSTEANLDEDVNNDGDKLDDVSRSKTDTIYTADNDLGSHTVEGTFGDYSVTTDNAPASWVENSGTYSHEDYDLTFTVELDLFAGWIANISDGTLVDASDEGFANTEEGAIAAGKAHIED